MQTHPRIGYDILSKSDASLFKLAAEVALYHHEKWDGGGYPEGLRGKAIPESARIVAIADVFDALSMKRPYKDAWPVEKSIEFLKEGSGQHFDPELLAIFIRILPSILKIKAEWDGREVVHG
jgi:putative two-component system response regulator